MAYGLQYGGHKTLAHILFASHARRRLWLSNVVAASEYRRHHRRDRRIADHGGCKISETLPFPQCHPAGEGAERRVVPPTLQRRATSADMAGTAAVASPMRARLNSNVGWSLPDISSKVRPCDRVTSERAGSHSICRVRRSSECRGCLGS